jgi:hypothetical protein
MQNQNLPYVLPINGPNLFMDKKSSMLTLARLPTSTKVALNLRCFSLSWTSNQLNCSPSSQPVFPALNEMSNDQAKPTTVITGNACDQLLNHLATHPNAIICCCASDMILCVTADAACLVLPNVQLTMTSSA